jgi:alpha-methylacyl-CoA racemase
VTPALEGVRVLDLSRLLPGPACTWYLQGMGAAVDRVETPGAGDFTRHIPPFVDGAGAYFAAVSRGKRSLAIDLRNPAAAGVLRRLLARYDVLVEGFKPGVMEQMGLAPEDLLREHPRLVIARLSGYGQTGPWRDRPGHDLNYVGLTGALAAAPVGEHRPGPKPVHVAALGGALVAATGIAAALYARERTGQGRILDVSLTEAALSFMAPHVVAFSAENREPIPGGEVLSGGFPVYGTYRCADGKWLTVGAVEPKFQAAVAAATGAVGRSDLAAAFARRTRDEWVEVLADACSGPALGLLELADHPQLASRSAVDRIGKTTWVRPPFASSPLDGPVPAVGEHTDAILEEGGFSQAERAALREARLHG